MNNCIGIKYNRLTVTRKLKKGYQCICNCGNETTIKSIYEIKSGHKKSCGCLNTEKRKEMAASLKRSHNQHGTKTYNIWKNMRARCNCPTSSGYYKYGGKGIKVCLRWNDFENFIEDMGSCPTNYSIERIDPAKNYEPGNCKWIPLKDQRWNKTNSRLITYNGITKNLSKWAQEIDIPRKTIDYRIKAGWTIAQALGYESR
jgi:hypothetical protein